MIADTENKSNIDAASFIAITIGISKDITTAIASMRASDTTIITDTGATDSTADTTITTIVLEIVRCGSTTHFGLGSISNTSILTGVTYGTDTKQPNTESSNI